MEEPRGLKTAIDLIISAGYQVDEEGFSFMKKVSRDADLGLLIEKVIEDLGRLQQRPLIIGRTHIERKLGDLYPRLESVTSSQTSKMGFESYAKNVTPALEILSDPTDRIEATGSLEDYALHFRDRFRKLTKILKNRLDVRDACSILDAFRARNNSKMKIICMIMERRESPHGIFLQVEDLEASTSVFVPSDRHGIFEKAQRLILDQVVCLQITKGKGSYLCAEDIILPETPLRTPNKAPVPVSAALISDLHIGSKMFMKDSFERFVLWLRGKVGNNNVREVASRVKYVVIAGDVVDGVGVYPQQFDELEITDLYRQYQEAAKILDEIPEYIEIIIIPGNHDACRRALPQPAISKEYAEPLYELDRIHLLGDPCTISLHGVNLLLSHGRSLDDVISTVPGMSFQQPHEAMKFLLQCRHLAPAYGLRTLIASEKVDQLTIERVPDVFHAGHVHMMKYCNYRGIAVVNSGAWQEQTEYQREMGHVPNPGIAPIVDLQTLNITPVSFVSIG